MGSLSLAVLLMALPLSIEASEIGAEQSADRFWKSFRQAVLGYKISEVISLTRFPFEVRGVDDGDPVKYYNSKEFKKVFNRILAGRVYILSSNQLKETSMQQIVEEKTTLTKKDWLTSTSIRIENLEFQKIKGHWRFTGAYLEE